MYATTATPTAARTFEDLRRDLEHERAAAFAAAVAAERRADQAHRRGDHLEAADANREWRAATDRLAGAEYRLAGLLPLWPADAALERLTYRHGRYGGAECAS